MPTPKEQAQRNKKLKERGVEKHNNSVKEVQKQVDLIIDKFVANPEPFFTAKEKEIAKYIEKYGNLQTEDIENGIITKKDYAIELSYYISKPIIPTIGYTPEYNANSLLMVNQFYWEKIVLPINQKMFYIPLISDLCRMLNISTNTFNNYAQNGDEAMREACKIIADQFIGYYQRNGMNKNISEIMAIFTLKTTYRQRENDVPQVQVNTVHVSARDKVNQYAKQYGYEIFDED